jgi:mono/diheme cytochrome c family protein
MTSTVRSIAARLAATLAMLSYAATVFAGQSSTSAASGAGLYTNYCASCHGPNAKGDGPMAAVLTKKPADLTMIAKRNGGKYPSDLVFRTIDGRNPVMGHGGQEMPVWGNAFLRVQGGATAEQARARVEALVNYLATIQQK